MATQTQANLPINWKITYEFINEEFAIRRAVIAVTAPDSTAAKAAAKTKLETELGHKQGTTRVTRVEPF